MIQTLTFEMNDMIIKANFLDCGVLDDVIGIERDIAVLNIEMFDEKTQSFVENEDMDIDSVIRHYESYKETQMTEMEEDIAEGFSPYYVRV